MMGWVISQPLSSRKDRILVTVAAVLPDIDGITLLGGVDLYHEYHHTFGHNIFLSALFPLLCLKFVNEKKLFFLLAVISLHSHLISDLLGSGADWGIYYFWPVSTLEFKSFPPFQWELDSWQNLVTTILFMIMITILAVKRERTIVEVFSISADKKVVAVLKKWFKK